MKNYALVRVGTQSLADDNCIHISSQSDKLDDDTNVSSTTAIAAIKTELVVKNKKLTTELLNKLLSKRNLSELKTLDVSFNALTACPAYAFPSTLVAIDISANPLRSFVSFKLQHIYISRLIELKACYCLLESIDDIYYASSLQYLDLSNNMLKQLDGIEILSKLKVLIVENNLLSNEISIRSLSLISKSLTELVLLGNAVTRLVQYRSIVLNMVGDSLVKLDNETLAFKYKVNGCYNRMGCVTSGSKKSSKCVDGSSYTKQYDLINAGFNKLADTAAIAKNPSHAIRFVGNVNTAISAYTTKNFSVLAQAHIIELDNRHSHTSPSLETPHDAATSSLPWRRPPEPLPRNWPPDNKKNAVTITTTTNNCSNNNNDDNKSIRNTTCTYKRSKSSESIINDRVDTTVSTTQQKYRYNNVLAKSPNKNNVKTVTALKEVVDQTFQLQGKPKKSIKPAEVTQHSKSKKWLSPTLQKGESHALDEFGLRIPSPPSLPLHQYTSITTDSDGSSPRANPPPLPSEMIDRSISNNNYVDDNSVEYFQSNMKTDSFITRLASSDSYSAAKSSLERLWGNDSAADSDAYLDDVEDVEDSIFFNKKRPSTMTVGVNNISTVTHTATSHTNHSAGINTMEFPPSYPRIDTNTNSGSDLDTSASASEISTILSAQDIKRAIYELLDKKRSNARQLLLDTKKYK